MQLIWEILKIWRFFPTESLHHTIKTVAFYYCWYLTVTRTKWSKSDWDGSRFQVQNRLTPHEWTEHDLCEGCKNSRQGNFGSYKANQVVFNLVDFDIILTGHSITMWTVILVKCGWFEMFYLQAPSILSTFHTFR